MNLTQGYGLCTYAKKRFKYNEKIMWVVYGSGHSDAAADVQR